MALSSFSLHTLALTHVSQFGWSERALAVAAEEIGIKDPRLVFDGGVKEWIGFYLDGLDEELVRAAETLPLAAMKIRERVRALIVLRLSLLPADKTITKRLLAQLAFPSYAPFAVKRVWKTADVIWRLAGDTATDWNHYSKRLLLSGVYSSSLLFWLTDVSPDHADTRAFVERRIDEVMKLAGKKKPSPVAI